MDLNKVPIFLTLLEARTNQLSIIANAVTLTGDSVHEIAQALVVIGDLYNYEASRAQRLISLLFLQYEIIRYQNDQNDKSKQEGQQEQKDKKNMEQKESHKLKWLEQQINQLHLQDEQRMRQTDSRLEQLEQKVDEIQKQIRWLRGLIKDDDK